MRHSEKWRISVATGQLFEDEARFRRAADGEYRWFLVRGVPLLGTSMERLLNGTEPSPTLKIANVQNKSAKNRDSSRQILPT